MDGTRNHATTAKDPVCNMNIDVSTARFSAQEGEVTYYFCSPACAQKFQGRPERYLNHTASPVSGPVSPDAQFSAPPSAISTSQASSGATQKDPVCGMTVNPQTANHWADYHG